MSMMAQALIAYEMFKDYMAAVFGGGVEFPSPLAPQPVQGYVK